MNSNGRLHVVVFPWLAFGHMLPHLELSKSLAKRGHRISFISTPRNIQRLPELPPQISHLVDFVPLELPRVDGIPESAEATSDLPPESVEHLKKAFDRLDQPFKEFIQGISPKPDWIIQDFLHHWIPEIAVEAGIPTILLSVFTAGSNVFFGPTYKLGDGGSRTTPEAYTVPPPWIPFRSNLRYRLHEARRIFEDNCKPNVTGLTDLDRCRIVLEGCTAVAVRSCMEVESERFQLLPRIVGRPVLPVGLLPPPPLVDGKDESNIVRWLDTRRPRSVAYVAFGSEATLSTEVMHELARGLELAGLPFVWAFRSKMSDLPSGFEERTKEHGIVARGWVPQTRILGHESTGGFLTHCGWSSVIESLQFGHPLVLLPIFADQGINARIVADKGIAVEIERDEEDGFFTKDAVARALRLAVVDQEGECYRKRAKELTKIFTDKDREEKYVDDFVRYLQEKHEK